jgi:hypothetical protein
LRNILLFLVTAGIALAQTNAGSITGTVFDQANAVVPGAKITATNVRTNVAQSALASSAGTYTIPALTPGTYRVVAEFGGFSPTRRDNIQVETSRVVQLDFALTVGSSTTEITVTTEAPLVQQSIASVQYSINQRQVDELPLPNQSVLRALEMIPGVVGDAGGEQTAPTMGFTMPGASLSVAGGRMGATQYKADGVENTSMYMGRISLSFSSDSIQEVQVQQNAFSAEYGRVGGGVVNMTTKSGTNQLHGTVFSFSQNDKLNAAPYTNSYRDKGKQRLWRGGVTVGGPIYIPKVYNGRDKSFFFFGYEPLRQSTNTTWFSRVPTDLERAGNFSQSKYSNLDNYGVNIFRQFEYNSMGTALTNTRIILGAGQAYEQFPGNRIPANLISPIGKKLVELMPKSNYVNPDPSLVTNYTAPMSVDNVDNRTLWKFDQVISDANRFSFRLAAVPTRGKRFYFGGKDSLADMNATDNSLGTNIAFSDTHTWGGNKVNEFRLGYNRSNVQRVAPDIQMAKNYFVEFGLPSRLDMGMPDFGFQGFEGPVAGTGQFWIDNIYQLTNIFNWVTGRHNLKIGGEFQMPQQNIVNYATVQGNWSFNRDLTAIGNMNTALHPSIGVANAATGDGVATALLGFPSGVNIAPAVIPYQYHWKYFAGFIQNDIKVTPRLTVNAGFRYQVEVPRAEKNHNQGNFVNEFATDSLGQKVKGYVQLSGLGNGPKTLFPTRYNNYEPRLGFAYRLPGEGLKWLKVVRAAYGISHVPTNGLFNAPFPDLNPRSDQLAGNGAANGQRVQVDRDPLILPNNWAAWPENGVFADLQRINTPSWINQSVTIPYMQQWNFGLGFEFSNNYGLELTYLGSKGTQLFGPSRRWNTINQAGYATQYTQGLNMGDQFPNPFGLVNASGNVITVSRQNLLRENPMLGTLQDPLAQGYNSNYNSLQANLIKRYADGLQFNLNYTLSKSMDNSSCEGQFCTTNLGNWSTAHPQLYSGDRSLERSVSTFDITHNMRFSFNYEVPFGRGKRFGGSAKGVLNHIIGNWKLAGLGSVQSGRPWLAFNGNSAGFPDDVGQIRPNWKPGVTGAIINPNWRNELNNPLRRYAQYYMVNEMFDVPERFTVGNVPRVIPHLRMPWNETFNASILKEFPIHEEVKLVFRAEFFNPFNHPNFIGNVNSNGCSRT